MRKGPVKAISCVNPFTGLAVRNRTESACSTSVVVLHQLRGCDLASIYLYEVAVKRRSNVDLTAPLRHCDEVTIPLIPLLRNQDELCKGLDIETLPKLLGGNLGCRRDGGDVKLGRSHSDTHSNLIVLKLNSKNQF